jgi:hypothetical protein
MEVDQPSCWHRPDQQEPDRMSLPPAPYRDQQSNKGNSTKPQDSSQNHHQLHEVERNRAVVQNKGRQLQSEDTNADMEQEHASNAED